MKWDDIRDESLGLLGGDGGILWKFKTFHICLKNKNIGNMKKRIIEKYNFVQQVVAGI